MKDETMAQYPLLSIVIANYNYGQFLADAIESVISQDMNGRVELIICDAGSSDNSVEVIKRYSNGLPPNTHYTDWVKGSSNNDIDLDNQLITWWCSEPDGGQSAAFNKGFAKAKGRFFTWLNADDLLLPGALKKFEEAFLCTPSAEWFGGGCIQLDPLLRVFKCVRPRRISELRIKYGLIGVTGPSSIFSAALYKRVGGVDERFQYTMDTNLWLRFACAGNAKYHVIDDYIWGLRLHPKAKMSGHKFLPDGTILEGAASRDAFVRQNARLEQLTKENAWTAESVPGLRKCQSRLLRFATMSYIPVLVSKFDSFRWRGQDVNLIFNKKRKGHKTC